MSTNEVADPGNYSAPTTILGRRQMRIPTAGKIHAGIQVLTTSAAGNPDIAAIYQRGVEENISFQKIAHLIVEQFPHVKRPLVPKNVPWFTVRPEDFPNRQIAAQIMELYAEDRGDGRRLYRFPVIFPTDTWQVIMPHELVTWSANDKRYWSEYAADGHTRHCMTFAPTKVDAGSKRVIRTFGGRAKQLREDNGGVCDPERCPQFQARQCNLSGRFVFYIPGIQSINAFELSTNSFYAMSRAIERFVAISYMRGGKIGGYLDAKRSTFYITKMLREVTRISDDGRPVKSAHWIIELEAPIDVATLLADRDDERTLRLAEHALRVFEPAPDADLGGQLVDAPATEPGDRRTAVEGNNGGCSTGETFATDDQENMNGSDQPPPHADALGRVNHRAKSSDSTAPTDLQAIWTRVAEFGIDRADFERFAAKTWGSGWHLNPRGRERVAGEVGRYAHHPEGLKDKIAAVLGNG